MKILLAALLILSSSSSFAQEITNLYYLKAKKLFDSAMQNPQSLPYTICDHHWVSSALIEMDTTYGVDHYIAEFCQFRKDPVSGENQVLKNSTMKTYLDLAFRHSVMLEIGESQTLSDDFKSWTAKAPKYLSRRERQKLGISRAEAAKLTQQAMCTVTSEPLSLVCRIDMDPKLKKEPHYITFYRRDRPCKGLPQ